MLKWRFVGVAAQVAAVGLVVVVVVGCGLVDHFRARVDLGSEALKESDSGCNDAVSPTVPERKSRVGVLEVQAL